MDRVSFKLFMQLLFPREGVRIEFPLFLALQLYSYTSRVLENGILGLR